MGLIGEGRCIVGELERLGSRYKRRCIDGISEILYACADNVSTGCYYVFGLPWHPTSLSFVPPQCE